VTYTQAIEGKQGVRHRGFYQDPDGRYKSAGTYDTAADPGAGRRLHLRLHDISRRHHPAASSGPGVAFRDQSLAVPLPCFCGRRPHGG
jgi:hypothetical protein